MEAREEVVVVGERLESDVEQWMAGYLAWKRACRVRETEVERARRRVVAATGGLGVAHWGRARDRHGFRTVEDAKVKATAVRARSAVETALADLQKTTADHEAAVGATRRELAVLSRRILAYGRLGAELTGLSPEDLGRLARSEFKTDC